MKVSRIRFWWCSSCKGVYKKEGLESRIRMYEGPGETSVYGSVTCARCSAVYQAADVWAGKHDLPQEHWSEFQRASGERMEL